MKKMDHQVVSIEDRAKHSVKNEFTLEILVLCTWLVGIRAVEII